MNVFFLVGIPFLLVHPSAGIYMWKYPCDAKKYPNNSILPFCDTTLSFEERAYDLVYNRYSVNELVNLTVEYAHSVPRYGISHYQWWNDAEHGVADSPGILLNTFIHSHNYKIG